MKLQDLFESKISWYVFLSNNDDTEVKVLAGPFDKGDAATEHARAHGLKAANIHIGKGRVSNGYLCDIHVPSSIIGPKIKIAK